MNLTIARVLTCSDDGCKVQPIDTGTPISTNFSASVIEHNIPIRPNQFVIVDQVPSPPETIFRFRCATVTELSDDQIKLDDGETELVAQRSSMLQEELQIGTETLLTGHTDRDRRVIDVVVNGQPAHADTVAAAWFPQMERFR